jgi:hypothetical protein
VEIDVGGSVNFIISGFHLVLILRRWDPVVQFPVPGRYFVACGVLPHFRDEMFAFIQVKGQL